MSKGKHNLVCIITGAGSGLGRAIALKVSKTSFIICLGRNESNLQKTLRLISASGGRGTYYKCDNKSYKSIRNAVKKIIAKYKNIDILINNAAAFGETALIERHSVEDWNETISTNINGTFYWIKEVLPFMKKANRGSILNVGSMASFYAHSYRAAYAVSKAAITHLTSIIASECLETNISCNCLAPTAIKGKRSQELLKKRAKMEGMTVNQCSDKFLRKLGITEVLLESGVAEKAVKIALDGLNNKYSGKIVKLLKI